MSFPHQATYSAEDDKLRIYFSFRLDRDEYQEVKDLGFRPAPKQGCHFAVWSPEREDFALKMAGEIEPEGSTLAERAEAKASRLEDLAIKNVKKANCFQSAANSISRRFEYGQPILIGHHSERKARRDKSRMESAMNNAVRCAGMVDYWNYKATSVERHANYKNRDDVRARRIKTLLAELRGYQRDINDGYSAIKKWEQAETLKNNPQEFLKTVIYLSGYGTAPHVKGESIYSRLTAGTLSPEEATEFCLDHFYRVVESERKGRWITHTLNRLSFERSMLGEVARFDDEITPVILQAFLREHGAESPKAMKTQTGFKAVSEVPFPVHLCPDLLTELEFSDEDWRDLMQSCGYEVPAKKERKISAKDNVPLINPTKEDAEKLQAFWNARMKETCENNKSRFEVVNISEMTQAIYSAKSKGGYSYYSTIEIDAEGKQVVSRWTGLKHEKSGVPVFRLRVIDRYFDFNKTYSVIVITDKPGKPLPITWA